MAEKLSEKEVYEKLCQSELDDKELAEIKGSLIGFFATLYKIDKRLKEEKQND